MSSKESLDASISQHAERRWTAWNSRDQERPGEQSPQPPTNGLPLIDGPSPVHARTLWEHPPTTPHRTYLSMNTDERESILSECLAHRDYYDPVYPNYRRLELLNRGLWNGKWEQKDRLHADDYWRFAHAIMCHLEMTDYQKQRFHYLFWKLTPTTRQRLGLPIEEVIFSVCMVVCWEDGRRASPRQRPWDPEFDQFATAHNVRKPLSTFEKVKRKLRPWLKDEAHRRRPAA